MQLAASADLQRFYEKYPYPCHDEDLGEMLAGRQVVIGNPRHWYHAYFPSRAPSEPLDVLVAGCGTREAARLAAGSPEARITGIDLSEASLAATRRLKEKHGLDNLDLRRLSLEDAAALDRGFDLIFCSGVLHHLADPLAGLAALRGVLRPGGAMNIMLYGRHGRLGIDMLREILRRSGARCDAEGIAEARRWFWNLPRQNPFRESLLRLNDINYDAGVADLLLHPRERNYTVPEIYEFLSRAGLVLQRFLCQAHYKPRCSAIATDPALLERTQSLPPSEQYAVTELFRGDMKKHVFIACRGDRPVSEYAIDFSGDGWRQYIPIRNPGLEASRDNLPQGAIARLRWGAHEYPEIAANVDDSQARLFDLVNGERTIAGILAASGVCGEPAALDAYARNFFESMWDFDYFWFRKPPSADGPLALSGT